MPRLLPSCPSVLSGNRKRLFHSEKRSPIPRRKASAELKSNIQSGNDAVVVDIDSIGVIDFALGIDAANIVTI